MTIPCASSDSWQPPPVAKLPNGTTPYMPHGEVSLIYDMMKMPDCVPTYKHGLGKVLPWVVPVYGHSSEVEQADFLYSLVRLLRPPLIVECGCHLGFTSWALGKACYDYEPGLVVTCDIDARCVETTRERCTGLAVRVEHCSVLDEYFIINWLSRADLVFIDSGTSVDDSSRGPALSHVKPGAIVVIHDITEKEIFDGITQTMQRIDFLETHSGFSLLRKL